MTGLQAISLDKEYNECNINSPVFVMILEGVSNVNDVLVCVLGDQDESGDRYIGR